MINWELIAVNTIICLFMAAIWEITDIFLRGK